MLIERNIASAAQLNVGSCREADGPADADGPAIGIADNERAGGD